MVKARLGPLTVDERAGFVANDTGRLRLSRKGVELLIRLGRAGGLPVRRESLLGEIWPDREVSDKSLSMLVVEVRRHLRPYLPIQDPIQTVPGIGYSLAVPYEPYSSPLLLVNGASRAPGRMNLYVAAPLLLSHGARSTDLGSCLRDTLLNTLSSEPVLEVSTREVPLSGLVEETALIIQSSVRVIQHEVMLSVRCVTPRDEKICWAASERAPRSSVFAAETVLCERLRNELRRAATAPGGRQAWKQYRQSTGFDSLTEGQRLVAARNKSGFSAARTRFKHALALDPGCAPALVGMADCEILSTFYDGAEVAGAMRKATMYVEHALALDAGLAAAHCTRGLISLAQLRFVNAEQELLEAIRLDDSNAMAFQWYADFLASQGRMDDAVQFGHLAVARAPHSIVVNTQLGQLLHMASSFDDAHAQLEKVLADDPSCAGAHCFLALNFAMAGNETAFEHARRALALSPSTPFFRGVYGSILAHLGEQEGALQQLHMLEALAYGAPAHAEAAMMVALTLGQPKRAIAWFRVATCHSAAWALYAAALPILAPLRSEPTFESLVRHRGMSLCLT